MVVILQVLLDHQLEVVLQVQLVIPPLWLVLLVVVVVVLLLVVVVVVLLLLPVVVTVVLLLALLVAAHAVVLDYLPDRLLQQDGAVLHGLLVYCLRLRFH